MSFSLLAILVVFPAAMAYAAASDIITMTISNRLCLILAATFLACAFALGLGWSQLAWHFAAGLMVLVICFGMFAAGWMGGGDAKLAAVTALWFGFEPLMSYVTVAALVGGVLTLAMLKMRSAPLPSVAQEWGWARRLHSVDKGIPYGVALAFAALTVLPQTAIWRAAIGL